MVIMKYNFKGKEVVVNSKLVPFVQKMLHDTVDDHYFDHYLRVKFNGNYDINSLSGKEISKIVQEYLIDELEACFDITFDENFNAFMHGEPFTLSEY